MCRNNGGCGRKRFYHFGKQGLLERLPVDGWFEPAFLGDLCGGECNEIFALAGVAIQTYRNLSKGSLAIAVDAETLRRGRGLLLHAVVIVFVSVLRPRLLEHFVFDCVDLPVVEQYVT